MSHGRERKEKNCLNCGAEVQGRFCQACGQENTEPHETFLGMVNHFFMDITHFDGKFFKTIGILATRPGFLSSQYIAGRRNAYLHPVRMYVFTSALFFLVFFSLYSVKDSNINLNIPPAGTARGQGGVPGNDAYSDAITRQDSIDVEEALNYFRPGNTTRSSKTGWSRINIGKTDKYSTLAQYDSTQASLPGPRRDGYVERMLVRKGLDMKERYPGQEGRLTAEILNKFLHMMPYLLFVSLPLYGFFLRLLYIRRKKVFFADHAIFLIHQYIFTFMLMLIFLLLMRIPYAWLNFLKGALFVYGIVYTLKAFRNFYRQGWGKTTIKFILFNILCVVSLTLLFIIFFGYAFFQV